MTQTLKRTLTRPKKTMKFKRSFDLVEGTIRALKSANAKFNVYHSAYSTTIEFPDEGRRMTYTTYNYRDKVFGASRCIVKDLTDNPIAHQIKNMTWSTNNFGSKNGWNPKDCKEVINIDISKAYASCLHNSGLISQRTFDFLNSLKKHERLPAVGMIAKRQVLYRYNEGDCVSFDKVTSEWSNIFFYVINQVNSCMRDCQMLAGEHFCFYWVDGIFVDKRIDKQSLAEIELCLQDAGYKYKYEKVENFRAYRVEEKIYVNMVKNGEEKQYVFKDTNFASNYHEMLNTIASENE
jgi:hypothetical protein